MSKLTLCMIVRNEVDCIAECLSSVQGLVNEIIIYDTGSTDGTMEAAAPFEAKYILGNWEEDFAAARNQGLAHATNDWVLVLDADEQLAPESKAVIQRVIDHGPPAVYSLPIRNMVDDDPNNATQHYMARLFFRQGASYEGAIHERLNSPYPSSLLADALILHNGYLPEVMEKKQKLDRNLSLLQAELSRTSDSALMHFYMGNCFIQLNQSERAEEHYLKVIELGMPEELFRSNAWYRLISISLCKGDIEQAYERIQDAEADCQHNPDYWVVCGEVLTKMGQLADAIYAFIKAYDLGQAPLVCGIHKRESVTWKPFKGIAYAYQLAGQPETAELFVKACRETYGKAL